MIATAAILLGAYLLVAWYISYLNVNFMRRLKAEATALAMNKKGDVAEYLTNLYRECGRLQKSLTNMMFVGAGVAGGYLATLATIFITRSVAVLVYGCLAWIFIILALIAYVSIRYLRQLINMKNMAEAKVRTAS